MLPKRSIWVFVLIVLMTLVLTFVAIQITKIAVVGLVVLMLFAFYKCLVIKARLNNQEAKK
ncbi:hypothetical protein R2R70_02525 [Cobetia sp. SIMBA_158]|uniref:hypothetical protein n=1 Tax=Cobetia sp. SIMBA_158 TaxID=3081617 RepID=UPI0039801E70